MTIRVDDGRANSKIRNKAIKDLLFHPSPFHLLTLLVVLLTLASGRSGEGNILGANGRHTFIDRRQSYSWIGGNAIQFLAFHSTMEIERFLVCACQ